MSTGKMFVMLFIYVAPFNYSFVYLFMEELTEIGKFIFAEGLLASLYPHPTQGGKGNGNGRELLLWTHKRVTFKHAARSADQQDIDQ